MLGYYPKLDMRKIPTRKIPTNQTSPGGFPSGKFPPRIFPPGKFPPMFLNIPPKLFIYFSLFINVTIIIVTGQI